MIRNYLKTALRNYSRHKLHTTINIAGFAIGVASFAMIFSYVSYQFSFDRYNKNIDRIYRLTTESRFNPNTAYTGYAWVQARLAPLLGPQYPEIENVVRLSPVENFYVVRDGQRFIDRGIALADSSIFDIFTFDFIAGDKRFALADPHSVVITRSASMRYFGSINSVAQTITVDNAGQLLSFTVTGVMQDVPPNSHLSFDMLIPYQNMRAFVGNDSSWCYTYVLLRKSNSVSVLQSELPNLVETYVGEAPVSQFKFILQPLKDIHLYSHLRFEWEPNMDISNIIILSVIAILILSVASANFTSILMSQYLNRIREVGVRKAVGADRWKLIVQFLVESTVTAVASTLIGIALAELAFPVFKTFADVGAPIEFVSSGILLTVFLVGIIAGVVSGLYPALYLSSFSASSVLRNVTVAGSTKVNLRKALVVFQFVVSIGLIVATTVIERQLDFMRNKSLGFDGNAVVVLQMPFTNKYEAFKNGLLEKQNIINVSASMYEPGQSLGTLRVIDPMTHGFYEMRWNSIEEDFLKVLSINLVDGQSFSRRSPMSMSGFLLNEEAVRELGWRSPIGCHLIAGNDTGEVIGVVKDVYFSSLRQKIGPTIYWYRPSMFYNVLIRVRSGNYAAGLQEIHSVWDVITPDVPFDYHFLDQDLDKLYRSEQRLGSLFALFGGFSMFVGSLGIFGLASHSTERRTKEIGIRKVLGASVPQLILLLTKEFAFLLLVANLIAWPVAYYLMNDWLQGFAYRIDMGVWTFLLAGSIALLIAFLSVSYQALKVAIANPVEALRYE